MNHYFVWFWVVKSRALVIWHASRALSSEQAQVRIPDTKGKHFFLSKWDSIEQRKRSKKFVKSVRLKHFTTTWNECWSKFFAALDARIRPAAEASSRRMLERRINVCVCVGVCISKTVDIERLMKWTLMVVVVDDAAEKHKLFIRLGPSRTLQLLPASSMHYTRSSKNVKYFNRPLLTTCIFRDGHAKNRNSRTLLCDQIGRFIGIWATF